MKQRPQSERKFHRTPVTTRLTFPSREATQAWAQTYLSRLRRPCVVCLEGEMGAGKTQLVRWFLEALGAHDATSPTFAIHHEYPTPTGPIDHVDLYRVESDADLESTGFWDLFLQPQGLVFVEWANRLPETVWPALWSRIRIGIQRGTGEARTLEVDEFAVNPQDKDQT
ncbi:MAG: tRNA (adenosine(37)-N6)-threonylcarbamoyltransferase complex ATPase subunit type 1 TsaE [Bdellovibrionales bacterium]